MVTVIDPNIILGCPRMIVLPRRDLNEKHMRVLDIVHGRQCFNERTMEKDHTQLLHAMNDFYIKGGSKKTDKNRRDVYGLDTSNWGLIEANEWAMRGCPPNSRIVDAMFVYAAPEDSEDEFIISDAEWEDGDADSEKDKKKEESDSDDDEEEDESEASGDESDDGEKKDKKEHEEKEAETHKEEQKERKQDENPAESVGENAREKEKKKEKPIAATTTTNQFLVVTVVDRREGDNIAVMIPRSELNEQHMRLLNHMRGRYSFHNRAAIEDKTGLLAALKMYYEDTESDGEWEDYASKGVSRVSTDNWLSWRMWDWASDSLPSGAYIVDTMIIYGTADHLTDIGDRLSCEGSDGEVDDVKKHKHD